MLTALYFMKGYIKGGGRLLQLFRALFYRPGANTSFARAGVDGKFLLVSLVEEFGSLRPSLGFISSGALA